MPLTTYTSGEVLTASSLNANLSFAASAGGLVLVKTQAVGTAVSTIAVTGAFSADYDNYVITYENGSGSTVDQYMTMILGATTTGYYYAFNGNNYNITSNLGGASNASSWAYIGTADSTYGTHLSMTIQSPFLTKRTIFNSSGYFVSSTAVQSFGMLQNTTSYTGFTLGFNTGTVTGGTIRVYGYANS
jgi:hypothetical protein